MPKPKGSESETIFADILSVRVIGADERFEVGKSWDSRGAVKKIVRNIGSRISVYFENGEAEYLINCPVIIKCAAGKEVKDT